MNLRKLNKLENSHPEAVDELLVLGFKREYDKAIWREALLKVINCGRADLPRYLQPNLPRPKPQKTVKPKPKKHGMLGYLPIKTCTGAIMISRIDDGIRDQ